MAECNETAHDITGTRTVNRIIADVNIEAGLKYIYDFERGDRSTIALVHGALNVPYDSDCNSKYNLPEPKEVYKFACNVYNNCGIENSNEIELETPWKLLYRVQGLSLCLVFKHGFYGELYFNTDNHYLILAIKGTSLPGDYWANLSNVLLNMKGGALDSAISFGEKVRQLMLQFKCKPMLIITGHSLGGYLAQVITFTITYFFKGEDGSVQSRETPSDDFGIYTMVFDSPAALKQIISIDARDPLVMKRFELPITNFVYDTNIINNSKWIGKHLGQVFAITNFENINQPGVLGKITSFIPLRSHRSINFKEIDLQQCKKVTHLKNKETVTYYSNKISSLFFSTKNFELLQKLCILAPMHTDLLDKLPGFTLSHSYLTLTDQSISAEEFIPRAHRFLAQHKDQLDSGKFDGKQILDTVALNLWRGEMQEDAHDLRLNEEWKQKVEQWPDGTKIGGFESHEEMRFVGRLLHNSIPRCFHYDYHKFVTLDYDQVLNFVITTKVALVLIVKDKNQTIQHMPQKEVKIVYLVLDSGEGVKIYHFFYAALDNKSQNQLKNMNLNFMGNKVTAKKVFEESLIENLRIWSIFSMNVESSLKDEIFYCDQKIASEDNKAEFKSATQFAHELSKGKLKFVLIASDAGMGKSTALMQIAKTMKNRHPYYWIVHLNLFSVQDELCAAKEKLDNKVDAIELVKNAALAKRKDDEVLKKLFDWKVEKKEMVLLFDSLDEICPSYKETAKKLIALLDETKIQIILTTRPQEEKNFERASIFRLLQFSSNDERENFILKKCTMMEKQALSDWLKTIIGKEEFWNLPLILTMAFKIYDPKEHLEATSDKKHKTQIYENFFFKSISNTLEIKIKLDKSLASGCYAEKFDQYNELIQILAMCTIFHSGKVTSDFEQKIEDNRNFINRFDLAKVDGCNKVSFLHRSFAEYLVANLFVQNLQVPSHKKLLLENEQLKSILFEDDFSDIREHICTIIKLNPVKLTAMSGFIKNREEKLLLSFMIEEDRYKLHLAFKDLLSPQQNNTTSMFHLENGDVKLYPLCVALKKARLDFAQQLINDRARFEAMLFEQYDLDLAKVNGLYKGVKFNFESVKTLNNETNNHHPKTPLQIDEANESRVMDEYLIENSADVSVESLNSFSALIYAIEANNVELLELLVTKEADSTEAIEWAAILTRNELFDIFYEKNTQLANL